MGIHVPDTEPEQALTIDGIEHFVIRRDGGLRQLSQSTQHEITFAKIAESQLPCDKAMPEDLPAIEQPPERMIPGPQVVDPDRGIYQDHLRGGRRRGAA